MFFLNVILIFFVCFSNSQNNLHCNCNGSASNGTAASMCSNSMFARKVPNHSPGQDGKRPAVTLTHLPKRPPVDIEFKNLAYSVSEGRKRGWSSKKKNNVLQERTRTIHIFARERIFGRHFVQYV